MPSKKNRVADEDTRFDRRGTHRATQRPADDRRSRTAGDVDDVQPRKRRATSDGREPLVVYMFPEAIKALKIAALQLDTTASAIVSEAVSAWLQAIAKAPAK